MPNWYETTLGAAIIKEAQDRAPKHRPPAPFGGMRSRMYASARHDRLTSGWAPANGSADSELASSLTVLRSRSRALCRDSSYAKRAKALVVNNVIGQGIGLQAQVKTSRDEPNARVNAAIEEGFELWGEADNCHTGGRLDFKSFERALMAQVFEAGEVFVREHYRPFGEAGIPYALELIEAERLPEEYQFPGLRAQGENSVRMGIEVDPFHRPVAYYIRSRHPSETRFHGDVSDRVERVPAEQIIHLALVDRWPQTRGEPWMHTVVRRLNDLDGYTEAEVIRARAQAVRMGIIKTPEDASSLGEVQDDGGVEVEMAPGSIYRLNPGEEWQDSAPSAPNPQLDPFMRYMLREMAAGVGVSYESLSRDYSQSNYSSSRLALLDDRDLWRVIQGWFICNFRQRVHRRFLQAAVLSRAIGAFGIEEYAANIRKFESVRFRPRGWGWVDPTKEVEAFRNAVRSGFTTRQDVISQSGQDFEEVVAQLEKEQKLLDEKGLVLDTDPRKVAASGAVQAEPEKPDDPPVDQPTEPEKPAPERASRFLRPVK
jgi:lambda family phage portal protein